MLHGVVMGGYDLGCPSLVLVVTGAEVLLRVAGEAEDMVDVAKDEAAVADGPGEDDMLSLQPPDPTEALARSPVVGRG